MKRRGFCIGGMALFGSLAVSQTSCMLLRPATGFMFRSYVKSKIKDGLLDMVAKSGTISKNSDYKNGFNKSSKPYNRDVFDYISPDDMAHLEESINILIKNAEHFSNEEDAMKLANHIIDQWNSRLSIEDSRNHIGNCKMCENSYDEITDETNLVYAKLDDDKGWFGW